MKNNKRGFIKTASLSQIFLLVISIVAFSYAIGSEVKEVSGRLAVGSGSTFSSTAFPSGKVLVTDRDLTINDVFYPRGAVVARNDVDMARLGSTLIPQDLSFVDITGAAPAPAAVPIPPGEGGGTGAAGEGGAGTTTPAAPGGTGTTASDTAAKAAADKLVADTAAKAAADKLVADTAAK
ncbi:MAG: hypothetical protein AABX28_01095, partial [Nanoarchaeota archaeon]